MRTISTRERVAQLPSATTAALATAAVLGLPCAAALLLHQLGALRSPALVVLAAVALSVAATQLGSALWKRRASSGDLLFGDLLLWGWLRRRRFDRLLARSSALVGPDAKEGVSPERRAQLLRQLSAALEARDPHTHGHSRRVARHAAALAKWMSLPDEEVARIRAAAVLHDVGKIGTAAALLEKPGPLTYWEYELVKQHAPVGAAMVASLGDPEMTTIVRHHHERLDGGGYPDGLHGEEIPLGARIVAVADTFDAVTSTRAYRPAMSHGQALALLDAEAGSQLDPRAVHAFRAHYSGYRPVVLWAGALSAVRQLGQALLNQLGPAAGAAKVGAIGAASVVAIGALQSPPVDNSGRLQLPAVRGQAHLATDHEPTRNSPPPPAEGAGGTTPDESLPAVLPNLESAEGGAVSEEGAAPSDDRTTPTAPADNSAPAPTPGAPSQPVVNPPVTPPTVQLPPPIRLPPPVQSVVESLPPLAVPDAVGKIVPQPPSPLDTP
ncbi:MAG: HD domain-containing protein [Thermoleophilia bacterium]|nr:HD domain-containing protein [Thermoleophilia bacterium]